MKKPTAVVTICLLSLVAAPSLAYEAASIAAAGKIRGVVRFAGESPPPQTLEVTKDFEACGTQKPDEEFVVSPKSKGLKNVVVSLPGIERGKDFASREVTLQQQGCRYVPHVLLIPRGGSLRILNEDGILHNIHTYSQANTPINMAQPKFKRELRVTFEKPEVVRMACDVHDWMGGRIVVMDHPYYALTDDEGKFEIAEVAPGKYQLRAWHEALGEMTREATVKSGETSEVTFEIVPH